MSKKCGRNGVTPKDRHVASHPNHCPKQSVASATKRQAATITAPDPMDCRRWINFVCMRPRKNKARECHYAKTASRALAKCQSAVFGSSRIAPGGWSLGPAD